MGKRNLAAASTGEAVLEDLFDEGTRRDIASVLWLEGPDVDTDDLPAGIREKVLSPKGSNEASGARMRARITKLLENPVFLLPDYRGRYEILLGCCDSLSPVQALAVNSLLGQDASAGYAPIPKPADARIELPRDHAVPTDFQLGWHFAVGNFRGRDSKGKVRECGLEYVVFEYSLLPPKLAHELGLSAVENQIVEGQFALTVAGDPEGDDSGRHRQAPPWVVAGTTGLVEYGSDPFCVNVGRNSMQSLERGQLLPMHLDVKDVAGGLEANIRLEAAKTSVLQGENGTAPSMFGLGSLYYSVVGITVDEPASYVVVDGEKITFEPGALFWFDHQWTTGLAPTGSPRGAAVRALGNVLEFATRRELNPPGWDWFGFQFDSDIQFTACGAHTEPSCLHQTGSDPPGRVTSPLVVGKIVPVDGTARDVTGTFTVTAWHKSPVTGTWLPCGYEFELAGAPASVSHFTAIPIDRTGQLMHTATGGEYREGPVVLADAASGERIGRGYAEGVGYADTVPFALASTGLPADDETIAKVSPGVPSPGLAGRSAAYLAGLAFLPVGLIALGLRGIFRRVRGEA